MLLQTVFFAFTIVKVFPCAKAAVVVMTASSSVMAARLQNVLLAKFFISVVFLLFCLIVISVQK